MIKNAETIRQVVSFVIWIIVAFLVFLCYAILNKTLSYYSLEKLPMFVVISFTIPYVLCKVFDILLQQFSHLIRGISSSLCVIAIGGTLYYIFGGPDKILEIIPHYFVPWVLVVAAYYILKTSQNMISNFNNESASVSPDISFIGFVSDEFCDKTEISPRTAVMVADLHRRAISLMERAGIILGIIVVLLILTALFIIFAGKIAAFGTVPIDHLTNMVKERDDIIEELDDLRNPPSRVKISTNEESEDDDKGLIEFYETRLSNYDGDIRKLRTALLTDGLINDDSNPINDDSKPINGISNGGDNFIAELLITTGITRIGVSIIAIYLVQILINLYRYNTQTAAYYRALADFLILADASDYEKIKSLHGGLLPNIGFKKAPKIVSQKIVDAISAALENFVQKLRRIADDLPQKTDKQNQPGRDGD